MATPGEDAPRLDTSAILSEASQRSAMVNSMLRAWAPREQIILELVKQVEVLKAIVPRRIVSEDGKSFVWRCPADLIPKDVSS